MSDEFRPPLSIRFRARQLEATKAVAAHRGLTVSQLVRDAVAHYNVFYGPWPGFLVHVEPFIVWGSNRRASEILGYTEAELHGMSVYHLYAPEMKARIDMARELNGQNGVIEGIRLLAQKKSGETFWVRLWSRMERHSDFPISNSAWMPDEDQQSPSRRLG